MGLSSSSSLSRRVTGSHADVHWNRLRFDYQAWKPSYDKWIEIESASDFERGTKNPLGQVRRLVQQHWKIIGWTKKASERLFTDLDSLRTEQLNIIFAQTWQIIVMNQIQLEFMAALTVSFVEPLLCWATTRYATMLSQLGLLSESRRLVDTHFLPLLW